MHDTTYVTQYCFIRNDFIRNSTQIFWRFKKPVHTQILKDKKKMKKHRTQNFCAKGQLISKCLFGVIVSTKKATKIL